MKKMNMSFIGQCIIIALLLVIIGLLVRDDDRMTTKGETTEVSVQEQATDVSTEQEIPKVNHEDASVSSVVKREPMVISAMKNEKPQEKVSTVLTGKNIVVFGDSIWNDARGEDGVSEHVMELTGSTVYNCAIGGTTAARLGERPENLDEWISQSFVGMVHVAKGNIPADRLLADTEALEVIKQVDFSNVDYILVSYGLNDYFSEISVYPETYYDGASYVGALRKGVESLKEKYPETDIVLLTPTYTEAYGNKKYKIGEYVEAMRGVAEEMDVHLADMFHIMGEDAASRLEQLDDGVHLSAEGREMYAEGVVWYLTEIENKKMSQ